MRSPNLARRKAAETAEITIDRLGHRGDGIGRLAGQTIYVPLTAPGDRVRVMITGRRGEGLAGRLVEVLGAGPARSDPPCPHFGRCGGCSLQHIDDSVYAGWKGGLAADALARQGFEAPPVFPLIRIPPGTRRRVSLTFGNRKDGLRVGFHARGSHEVVDIGECRLLRPELADLLPAFRRILVGIVPVGVGGGVHAVACENGLDLVIDAPVRLDAATRERLAAFAGGSGLARLSWGGQEAPEPLVELRRPVVRFAGIAVALPPGAFLQPSAEGERAIAERVMAAVGDRSPVVEFYSGCGSFTLPLARRGPVQAFEGAASHIGALVEAARASGLPVTADRRDLVRRPPTAAELAPFRVAVLDPPRAGAEALARVLAVAGPERVVMVSCEMTTLARDARILADGGYVLDTLTPIDQFSWSAHLEAVAVFTRTGARS